MRHNCAAGVILSFASYGRCEHREHNVQLKETVFLYHLLTITPPLKARRRKQHVLILHDKRYLLEKCTHKRINFNFWFFRNSSENFSNESVLIRSQNNKNGIPKWFQSKARVCKHSPDSWNFIKLKLIWTDWILHVLFEMKANFVGILKGNHREPVKEYKQPSQKWNRTKQKLKHSFSVQLNIAAQMNAAAAMKICLHVVRVSAYECTFDVWHRSATVCDVFHWNVLISPSSVSIFLSASHTFGCHKTVRLSNGAERLETEREVMMNKKERESDCENDRWKRWDKTEPFYRSMRWRKLSSLKQATVFSCCFVWFLHILPVQQLCMCEGANATQSLSVRI